MANGFKKFIDVSGKTSEEIKKSINSLLNGVVDTVVGDVTQFVPGDVRRKIKQSIHEACQIPKTPKISENTAQKEYKAEKIPPRKQAEIKAEPEFEPEVKNMTEGYRDQDGNYIPPLPPKPPEFDPDASAYPREPFYEPQDEQDAFMVEKIREMRKLEETTRNNYIVKRCAEVTMIKQGEFMKDVTDDFPRRVFCALPRPVYAAMSNSQLRTYFSWRTDWQRGIFEPVDKPYVMLYCYEVLNKIGFDSSDKAFAELVLIREKLGGNPSLVENLPRWICDFYAFNRVSLPLPEFCSHINDSPVSRILRGDYTDAYGLLSEHSSYNIKDSIFTTPVTLPYLKGCCKAVLTSLEPHFEKYGFTLAEILCGKLKKNYFWEPFYNTLTDIERMDGFQPTEINALERYSLKRGEPVLETFEFSPSKHIIGYILKSIEARLRKITGFSHSLSPKTDMFKNDVSNRGKLFDALNDPEFVSIITAAVDAWCKRNGIGKPPKKDKKFDLDSEYEPPRAVEIDISKLNAVREQAELNASRLIIPDEPDVSDISEKEPETDSPSEFSFEDIADQINDDEFNEAVAEYSEPLFTADKPDDMTLPPHKSEELNKLTGDWQELALNLTPLQVEAVKALLGGTIEEFCRSKNLFAETVFEQINAEALESVGDVVIESGAPVEDYLTELETIARAF